MKGKGGTKTVLNRRGSRAAQSGREPLNQALTYWIYFLRTGQQLNEVFHPEEITVSTTKDVLVEIKIMSPLAGTPHPLADSGFGYSQVLPILVTTLLADIGETVIVEQPELHLNPALQVRLAEFFVAMARSGKQVLIETHSEHIVNAIRVLTAEDESGELTGLCGLHFIDTANGSPLVRSLDIQPDGTVPEWPQHFFGEAASLGGHLCGHRNDFVRMPGSR